MGELEPIELSDLTELLRAFVFVRPDATNIERLRAALLEVFHDDSVNDISSEDLAGAYPVVRYGPPVPNEFTIDFIGRLGDTFSFEDIEAETIDIDGITAHVATAQMLYRMKRDTLRPNDQRDADALRLTFNLED